MPESAWATKRAVCCPWRWTNPPTNRTSSLGIPLRLIYKPFKHFQASVIAYSDFGIELTSLHKKPRVEYELSGLRTYQFGVGGTVSYYGIGIFASYGVTPLFKKHAGPECHTFSFGISLLM